MSLLDRFELVRKKENVELTGFEDHPVDLEKELNLYTREGQFYVLLADANDEERVEIERIIDQMGCFITSVSTGMQCMMEITKDKYDLILLSRNMPRMDGVQTLRNIKSSEQSKCRDAKIYVILDEKVEEPDIYFENEGFDGLLRKPIDKTILQNVIINLVPQKMLPDDDELLDDIREIAEDAEVLKNCDVRLIEGLQNFKGDMDAYMRSASKFCEDYEVRSADMLDALYSGKKNEYMEMVRYEREAARQIGAIYLADCFDDHVNMSKQDSLDVAESNWQSLVSEWENVITGISAWLGKTNQITKTTDVLILKTNGIKLSKKDTKEMVSDILSSMEQNDVGSAYVKIDRLSQYELDIDVRRKIDQAKKAFDKERLNVAVDILKGLVQ